MGEANRDLIESVSVFAGLEGTVKDKIAAAAQVVDIAAGEYLVRMGDVGDAMFVIVAGEFAVQLPDGKGGKQTVATLKRGQPVGEMQIVVGGTRSADVVASGPGQVLKIAFTTLDELAEAEPLVLINAATVVGQRVRSNLLSNVLRSYFKEIDETLIREIETRGQWQSLSRGECLFRQGDDGDAWYLLVRGRLQVSINGPNGSEIVVNEVSAGETVGEIALLAQSTRTASIYALRQSELLRFDRQAYDQFSREHHQFGTAISSVLVQRLLRRDQERKRATAPRVIAFVSGPEGVQFAEFSQRLAESFRAFGTTKLVDQPYLQKWLGRPIHDQVPPDHPVWYRFDAIVEEVERNNDFVILDAGNRPGQWLDKCLQHADACVYVCEGSRAPDGALLRHAEAQVSKGPATVKWSLLLTYPDANATPQGTAAKLAAGHFERHYHLRLDHADDFGRTARLLARRGYGLALGGGGARGLAHIGVLRAFRELGIAVDAIGGTSMGAIIAGFFATGSDIDEIAAQVKAVIRLKPFTEYTIPMVSLVKTARAQQAFEQSFGDRQIEDLWYDYFAISANLTTAKMVTHKSGSLLTAVRASSSLPGVLVPVQTGEHLLVDGGVINNLPADVVGQRAGGMTIAVNVSPAEDVAMRLDKFPSQWKIFWHGVLPFRKRIEVPRLGDILMRTIMLSSADRFEAVRKNVDLLLAPPIDNFGMLQFDAADDIIAAGYDYARPLLEAKLKEGAI